MISHLLGGVHILRELILCIVLYLLVSQAMAAAVYENDVKLETDNLRLTILETYNLTDASEFRTSLDTDNNSRVTELEVSSFKKSYLASRSPQFMDYVKLDDGNVTLYMNSISLNIYNATGNVTQAPLYVNTTINYGLTRDVGTGDHSLWVMGHPQIKMMRISLPKSTVLVSDDGLDNLTMVNNDPVVMEGKSGIRSFMVGNRSTFEYAAYIKFKEPHLYERGYIVPFLVGIELLLVLLVLYLKRKR